MAKMVLANRSSPPMGWSLINSRVAIICSDVVMRSQVIQIFVDTISTHVECVYVYMYMYVYIYIYNYEYLSIYKYMYTSPHLISIIVALFSLFT